MTTFDSIFPDRLNAFRQMRSRSRNDVTSAHVILDTTYYTLDASSRFLVTISNFRTSDSYT